MEFRGFKLDLIGLAAAIGAIATLWTAIKGARNKEKQDARKDEEDK